MSAYQNTIKESKGNNGTDRPVLRRTIVSDFTLEALMLANHNCPRGITILADEILGMFNSANLYNNGQLIEQLLSTWSNSAINVTRVSNPIPIHIENPCINMVGTTQTKRVHELLKKVYEDNGLLDRILFVMPKSYLVPRWTKSEEEDTGSNPASAWRTWEAIMEKVFALNYEVNDKGKIPHLIGMEALIAAHFMPDGLWLATGGKNGCFNEKAVCVLEHRDVVLMPDLGATEQWKQKTSMLANVCRSVSVSTVLEDMATDEQRDQGLNITDFLLMEDTPQMILQRMINRNPVLQTLIDELGLELVEEP